MNLARINELVNERMAADPHVDFHEAWCLVKTLEPDLWMANGGTSQGAIEGWQTRHGQAPKLGHGEQGTGDLFKGGDQPFNLAGGSTTDGDRVAAEKAKAESDKAEAARIEKARQTEFPEGKEPWEMTRQEHRNKEAAGFESLATMPEGHDIVGNPTKRLGEHAKWQQANRDMAEQTRAGKNSTVDMMHQLHVQKALERGKKVPEQVLADYPHLKK